MFKNLHRLMSSWRHLMVHILPKKLNEIILPDLNLFYEVGTKLRRLASCLYSTDEFNDKNCTIKCDPLRIIIDIYINQFLFYRTQFKCLKNVLKCSVWMQNFRMIIRSWIYLIEPKAKFHTKILFWEHYIRNCTQPLVAVIFVLILLHLTLSP